MSDLSNICLPCGICCDGTLIGFVELENEELPRLKKIMDIEDERDHGFFLQPCKKYCNGCTIYSERPKQCGKFECGLLKSVEEKELEFDSALDIVNNAKQLRISIEKKLEVLDFELKSTSFYFKMVELKKVFSKKELDDTLTQNHLKLKKELIELDILLSDKFGVTLY
ncbi:YkgJ family cysteine cluster protein [Aurantibacter sp.]|uniref:YkgJ family cysteine cluster protein n=1 Tax=Aurantibacter sp. TaxID=2807103 RepID=UPI0035C7E7D9